MTKIPKDILSLSAQDMTAYRLKRKLGFSFFSPIDEVDAYVPFYSVWEG